MVLYETVMLVSRCKVLLCLLVMQSFDTNLCRHRLSLLHEQLADLWVFNLCSMIVDSRLDLINIWVCCFELDTIVFEQEHLPLPKTLLFLNSCQMRVQVLLFIKSASAMLCASESFTMAVEHVLSKLRLLGETVGCILLRSANRAAYCFFMGSRYVLSKLVFVREGHQTSGLITHWALKDATIDSMFGNFVSCKMVFPLEAYFALGALVGSLVLMDALLVGQELAWFGEKNATLFTLVLLFRVD